MAISVHTSSWLNQLIVCSTAYSATCCTSLGWHILFCRKALTCHLLLLLLLLLRAAEQQFSSLLGCANPDGDPLGAWCPVDPRSCPSHYGAKQPRPGEVPPSLLNRWGSSSSRAGRQQASCVVAGGCVLAWNVAVDGRCGSDVV
jgi:hypothetical protein